MVERKVGHSALKWNKDKQELETFDPNPAKEGEMEPIKIEKFEDVIKLCSVFETLDRNATVEMSVADLRFIASKITGEHLQQNSSFNGCRNCLEMSEEVTRLRNELAEKEAEKNEYKKCFEAELEGNNYYCKKYAKEHETFREFLGRIFSEKENSEAALTTERERVRELERQIKILEIKNRSSLANNLCPDHRDKQKDKPCLACTIEKVEKDLKLERENTLEMCKANDREQLLRREWKTRAEKAEAETNELREVANMGKRLADYVRLEMETGKISDKAYLPVPIAYRDFMNAWQAIKQAAGEGEK